MMLRYATRTQKKKSFHQQFLAAAGKRATRCGRCAILQLKLMCFVLAVLASINADHVSRYLSPLRLLPTHENWTDWDLPKRFFVHRNDSASSSGYLRCSCLLQGWMSTITIKAINRDVNQREFAVHRSIVWYQIWTAASRISKQRNSDA